MSHDGRYGAGPIEQKQPVPKGYIWLSQECITVVGAAKKPRRIKVIVQWEPSHPNLKIGGVYSGHKDAEDLPTWIQMA